MAENKKRWFKKVFDFSGDALDFVNAHNLAPDDYKIFTISGPGWSQVHIWYWAENKLPEIIATQ